MSPTPTTSPTAPSSSTPSPLSILGSFTTLEKVLFWTLIFAGIALRWTLLDARPVHHDESLHMMYGRYFFDFPDLQYYKYDPMLHGPLLYNIIRVIYTTLGSNTWAGRAPVALMGTAMVFAPLLFSRYFSKHTLLFLTAGVALSPTITYWNRFIREDTPIVFFMIMMAFAVTVARPQFRYTIALSALSLQFCLKENAFVTVAILAGYLIYEALFLRIVHSDRDHLFGRMVRNGVTYWPQAIFGALLAFFLFYYLFTEQFRYPQGFTDFFEKSVSYWMKQHNIERIKGPFNFHLYVMGWYELPFLLLTITQIGLFYRYGTRLLSWIGAGIALVGLAFAVAFWDKDITGDLPWSIFKLKDSLDIAGLLILLTHSVLITSDHLLRKERALAFWGYLFYASFFTYSYLGEKVPWLTIYPFAAGLAYIALYFDHHFKTRPLAQWREFPTALVLRGMAVVIGVLGALFFFEDNSSTNWIYLGFASALGIVSFCDRVPNFLGTINIRNFALCVLCLYSLRATILTNYTYAGHASEFISQVHTTNEFQNIIKAVRREMTVPIRGYRPKLFATGEVTWPLTWYMVGVPEYKFNVPAEERAKYDYQFIDFKEKPEPHPGYRLLNVRLRGWWVPDYKKMTLKRFLNYSLNHTPWGDSGYTWTTLLVKENAPVPPEVESTMSGDPDI